MIAGAALAIVLSASQLHWATVAYQLGEPYGLGSTLVALEGQESSYCRFKGTSWSRGCLGFKRATARIFDIGVSRKQLTDDDNRNLRDGLAYLLYCRERTKDWQHMVAAFHYGVPAESKMSDAQIATDGYVLAIVRRLHEIKVDT